jgi:hypothetical protein
LYVFSNFKQNKYSLQYGNQSTFYYYNFYILFCLVEAIFNNCVLFNTMMTVTHEAKCEARAEGVGNRNYGRIEYFFTRYRFFLIKRIHRFGNHDISINYITRTLRCVIATLKSMAYFDTCNFANGHSRG